MASFEWPPKGGGGVPIFPNIGAFPPTAPNGSLAKDASTHILYEYNSSLPGWEPIASNPAYESALGAITTIGPFGSTPNAAGGIIVGNVLTLEPASATFPGGVTIGPQSFGGNKTFTGTISALNLNGQNSGDASVVFRPGGVAGGVVYTSWASLYAAIVTLDLAAVSVTFDNSIQPIVIPAGTYSLPNVTFEATIGQAPSNPIGVTLAIGCIFAAFPVVTDLVTMVSESTSTVFTPSGDYLINLAGAGNLISDTGSPAPMITVPAGITLYITVQDLCALQGVAAHPLIALNANSNLFIFTGSGANIGSNIVSGPASANLFYIVENPSISLDTTNVNFLGTINVQYAANIANMTVGSGVGDIPYATINGQGTFLSADTSNVKKFLTETSIAGAPQPPIWSTISSGDLPPISLQEAYNGSTSPEIVLTSSPGGLQIQDNASPLGASLFSVAKNGGSLDYLNVAATSAGTALLGVNNNSPTHTLDVLLPSDNSLFIDARTNVRTTTDGTLAINQTAGISSTTAINLDINSAAFADSAGVNINWASGALAVPSQNNAFQVSVNGTNSTNGIVNGLDVETPALGGLLSVNAVRAGPNVNPISQLTGPFVNTDQSWYFNSVAVSFTSITTGLILYFLIIMILYI